MAKLTVKAGSTSRIEHVFVLDSASTTGAGKTGITNSTVKAYYIRNGGTNQQVVSSGGNAGFLNSASVGTWTSGGWAEVSSTNMPGLYELHVPDAVFASASGVNHAVVMLWGATGMAPVVLEYDLVAYDPTDALGLGLTRFDATISSRSTLTASDVWSNATRTLTSFGTLAADVWASSTRTLTSFGTLVADVWANGTRTLTAGTNISLAKGTGVTGFNDLSASDVRSAVGLASANLDTQLDALPTATENAAGVWGASLTTYTDNSTFGGRIIRGKNGGQNDVEINGNNHVSAVVHSMQTGTVTADALAADAANEIADAFLNRNIAGGSSTGRVVKDALRFLRNKFVVSGSTLTVYQEDDTTTAWTSTVASDPTASPITGSDPS